MDEHARIIDEARMRVASGGTLDPSGYEARILAAGGDTKRALAQLARVVSVARARALVSGPAQAEPAPPPPRPPLILRAKPTITGNMDVRRERHGDAFVLVWPREPKVAAWDVRISERVDVRGDYVVRDELSLEGGATAVELPLGEHPLRIHLLGRDRGGRLVRRAIVSALTREGWSARWERRASAS